MHRRVTIGHLPNGVQVNCMSDKVSFVSGIGTDLGAIDDPLLKTGLVHLSEHMIARETPQMNARAMHIELRKLTGWGEAADSDLNVRIDWLSFLLGHGLLCDARDMVSILTLLAGAYINPFMRESGLQSEKAAIHTETRIFGLDDIVSELELALMRLVYTTNPMHRRIDSEIDELMKINHTSAIRRLFKQKLVPHRTFVNIFGPSHGKSMELARRLIGDWTVTSDNSGDNSTSGRTREKRAVAGYDGSDNFPILTEPREREKIDSRISGYYLVMGFPIPEKLVQRDELIEMVADIIAFESFESLRTGNFNFYTGAYRVIPVVNISFINGLMYFWTATSSKRGIEIAEAEILRQCRRIFDGFIDPILFEALKYRKYASWTSMFKGYTDILAEEVISHIVNGDWDLRKFHTRVDKIKSLNIDKVKRMAGKLFSAPQGFNYAKVYFGPE